MPVHKILMTQTDFRTASVEVWLSANPSTVKTISADAARTALSGAARNNPALIAAKATELLQALIDVRTPLAGLPSDDPDKTVNPNRRDLFWDGTDLVGRGVVVLVTWTGSQYRVSATSTVL